MKQTTFKLICDVRGKLAIDLQFMAKYVNMRQHPPPIYLGIGQSLGQPDDSL